MEEKPAGRKGIPMPWIVAVIVIALIVWFVYSASQTFVIRPDRGSIPGMNMSAQATSTMPANMPGMNH